MTSALNLNKIFRFVLKQQQNHWNSSRTALTLTKQDTFDKLLVVRKSIVVESSRMSTETARASNSNNTPKSGIDNSERWYTRGKPIHDVPEGVFKGILDRFNGITIDSSIETLSNQTFAEKLARSLKYWIESQRRGIWFRVHTKDADWVPVLVKNEFVYHHARQSFVMMCRWLPENEEVGFPPYAHTMLGVGAVVVNDKNEILVVSEKNALIANSWKLPGGYVEPGENFTDAAIREVQEETNIRTRFDSLVSIRHAHGAGFGCSDLYVVISLIPETSEIRKCEREIAKSEWMDIDVFLAHPDVHETNRNFLRSYLDYKKNDIKISCNDEIHQMLKKKYQIYKINFDGNDTASPAKL